MRHTLRAIPAILLLIVFLTVPLPGIPQEMSPESRSEIAHLLGYIEKSGCRFYRNGSWYEDVKGPLDHVKLKYDYFMKKGRIKSTEDFIKLAATKSEISGKTYLVQCNNGPEIPTARWLADELARFRSEKKGEHGR